MLVNVLTEKILLDAGLFDIIVFFSPSGASAAIPLLQKIHGNRECDKIQFVAIGPSTEKEISNLGFQVNKVAVKPNPVSLRESLDTI